MFSLIFQLIKLKFYWKKHFTIVFHDFFKIMLSFSLKAYQWVIAKSGKTNSLLVGNTAKGRISKRVLQEKKTRQIFRKRNISFLLIRTHVCLSGDKICSFFGKSGGLFFFVTPVLRLTLLAYCQWNHWESYWANIEEVLYLHTFTDRTRCK